MAVFDAHVYVWTSSGMQQTSCREGYIATIEVEELLKQAHQRGYNQGYDKAQEEHGK